MFKKILVPLDGSEFGEKALKIAREMAVDMDSEIYLTQAVEALEETYILDPSKNVVSVRESVSLPHRQRIALTNPILNVANDYLDALAHKLQAEGIKVRTHVMEGKAAEAILDYSDTIQPDVIVMTTHGRSGLNRTLLGSVTDRVLRHGKIPVLVVRSL